VDFVSSMTSDSNNNALDAGLDCAFLIFENLEESLVVRFGENIVRNIIEKSFPSRPSTQSKGKQLILKIMENSDASIYTQCLIEKLHDKRPKVPPMCIETIQEGINLFGATSFPLKDIMKVIPSVFNSTNNASREGVLNLVHILLKWVGPSPFLPMMENLRPAQKAEIEK
jgi:cytoskeleton-associated protein 5